MRTGRIVSDPADEPLETKFNPYHDPENGQFTFGPGGAGLSGEPYRSGGPKARPTTLEGRRDEQARLTTSEPAVAPARTASFAGDAAAAKARPIKGYPEDGKNSWRKTNDAIFEKATDDFNRRNRLKPGDPRYMDPQLMKAWAMFESGGDKDAFLSDPFQVNNPDDWDDAKKKFGLGKGQPMTPETSARAALQWLDMKGHITKVKADGTRDIKYVGKAHAFRNYNGNNHIDSNGKSHKDNYVNKGLSLYIGR